MTVKDAQNLFKHFPEADAEKVTLAIQLTEDGVGPTPSEEVENIVLGFDWDKGKLMIIPSKPLAHIKENPRETKKEKFIRKINGVTICHCPSCSVDIDPLDRFCKNCGQKF
jgi:hypothetical protein